MISALRVVCAKWIGKTGDMRKLVQATVTHTPIQKAWHIGTQQVSLTPLVRRACLYAAGISLAINESVIIKLVINNPVISYFLR